MHWGENPLYQKAVLESTTKSSRVNICTGFITMNSRCAEWDRAQISSDHSLTFQQHSLQQNTEIQWQHQGDADHQWLPELHFFGKSQNTSLTTTQVLAGSRMGRVVNHKEENFILFKPTICCSKGSR